jgi:hypothetical protein
MDITSNMPINTPDGDGIVLGRTLDGKIVVRLDERKEVAAGRKSKTFNGWQDEYDLNQLRLPQGKKK